MKKNRIQRPTKILLFTVGYVVLFTALAIYEGNIEFLYYTVIMLFLIWISLDVHHKIKLDTWIISSLSFLGLLHLGGGNLYFRNVRLYDITFFGGLLRYDNVVHFFGTFVLTFIVYSLLWPIIDENLKKRKRLILMGILILMALGVGSINEIIEFIAVEFLGAADKVGDYQNNAKDIVFNFIGALIASFIIYHYYKEESDGKKLI